MTMMSFRGKRTEEKGGVGITSTKNDVNKDRKLVTIDSVQELPIV